MCYIGWKNPREGAPRRAPVGRVLGCSGAVIRESLLMKQISVTEGKRRERRESRVFIKRSPVGLLQLIFHAHKSAPFSPLLSAEDPAQGMWESLEATAPSHPQKTAQLCPLQLPKPLSDLQSCFTARKALPTFPNLPFLPTIPLNEGDPPRQSRGTLSKAQPALLF